MGRKSQSPRADFDGAWKLALDRYLDPFLRLCFPAVHAGIDWSRKHAALDQELQQAVRDAETGKRRVDKLYRVLGGCTGTVPVDRLAAVFAGGTES